MAYVANLSNIVRSEGDPKVIAAGRSSMSASDQLARALGWFSIGLGLTELLAPRFLARTLGVEGKEGLLRAYGLREIGAGMMSLSPDKAAGMQSRVLGDALDMATLAALRPGSSKPDNLGLALAAVLGVTLLDVIVAVGVRGEESRDRGERRAYRDQSGYPQGLQRARGAARDFKPPLRMAAPTSPKPVAQAR